ncbi:exodeoxyribonuclease V subunit beta [Haemophilus paracuniculus]|uniref:RecBCD enzyme subunit RecB n=1 Tax=Haemophilus paracuniculus TaxID=734 RepID=A0A1T0AR42_9PAST|nr:exodeoxyribonuclease V subunit beta [Haemophilus paracuniculus]OOR98715.1 exodeoxyribonuclease V subunit beta [Haemophilus paracuniculus]
MENLNALTLPLDTSVLIEASAGTGKTYTIANLFVRLLLKDEAKRNPLNINEILVVTFTTLATQELRDRIRKRLAEVRKLFSDYKEKKSTDLEQDQAFLFPLYQNVIEQDPDLSETLLRLSIAEKEIDLANIFTIDSFCQKMLFQFAFDSGVPFDIELNPDENELLTRLNQEIWREQCYPLKQEYAQTIYNNYKTPDNLLWKIRPYLYQNLPEQNKLISENSLNDLFERINHHIRKIKQKWQENQPDIIQFLQTEPNLNRRSYRSDLILKWAEQINEWANSTELFIPDNFSRFCQRGLDNPKARKNAEQAVENALFAENEANLTAYEQQFGAVSQCIEYHFLLALRQKLAEYKSTHKDKTFKDIQILFNQALKSDQGERLISQIQNLYQFAMIDEFQDTDQDQYEIFSQLFMGEKAQQKRIGFIMIGDPKQSIYKFRGADIFTYLTAKEKAEKAYTLNKNWRSLPEVVESTNQLFQFNETEAQPFLYKGIDFQAVSFNPTETKLVGESYTNYYVQTEFNLELAAEQCAYKIQQQLKKSSEKRLYLAKNETKNLPIQPEDITVLVRDRNQADLMQATLKKYHIDAVISNNKNSVFYTIEAKNIAILLKACLEPFNSRAILATLGTTLWAKSANEIYQLKNNEAEWDLWVNKFLTYQKIWQQQGVLPMLHEIFRSENMLQHLKNTTENSERSITNLFHLAELLQQAMPLLENELALLHWFEEHINDPQGSDEQLLRLENERKLVKIITIHSSKGLEYPIVWLPFVAKKSHVSNKNFSVDNFAIYKDLEQNKDCWAFENKEKATEAIIKEELAEELRLLYVAVTRAKYQINFILPRTFENGWNAMHYLLSNGAIGIDRKYETENDLSYYLNQKRIQGEIIELPDMPTVDEWQPTQSQTEITALEFTGNTPRYIGSITSFTQLESQSRDLQKNNKISPLVDNALDYDNAISDSENNSFEEDNEYSPIKFPRSAKVGNLLHKFFETSVFSQPISNEKITKLCEQLDLNEKWIEPTKQWFKNIMQTPFAEPAFSLNQIDEKQRLNEWQFYLRLSNRNALPELNKLLKKYSPIAKNLPDLNLLELEGFVKGYVDCIVKINDKFYILDYKSNSLSAFGYDFSPQNIEKEIGKSRYDLQYILYTLAIHRYLRFRLGKNYDYDNDFGGIAYLFLRGMNGTPNSGVYFEKPSKQLIEEMDLLFD